MELWVGKAWHWGCVPQHHEGASVAQDIRDILEDGDSVNCYMFHGGTNFGFTSGVNWLNNTYCPLLTSYEVDVLLDEAGNPTEKYYAIQQAVETFRPGSTAPVHFASACAYDSICCTEYAPLSDSLDVLSSPVTLPLPELMKYFGQSFGFIHYSTTVEPFHSGCWQFQEMRDRAIVILNGNPVATIYRNDICRKVFLDISRKHSRLDILVENMGRINYGLSMESEKKGIRGFCREGGIQQLNDWTVRPLPLNDLSKLKFRSGFEVTAVPAFYWASLPVKGTPQDTFLHFPEGLRGCVWGNGFNIGRYWTIGPQRTLYLPSPLLQSGKNQILVFELHGLRSPRLEFSCRGYWIR